MNRIATPRKQIHWPLLSAVAWAVLSSSCTKTAVEEPPAAGRVVAPDADIMRAEQYLALCSPSAEGKLSPECISQTSALIASIHSYGANAEEQRRKFAADPEMAARMIRCKVDERPATRLSAPVGTILAWVIGDGRVVCATQVGHTNG